MAKGSPNQSAGLDMDEPMPLYDLFVRLRSRAFHTYFRFARGMTLGAQACVIDAQNRVFLVRHTYISGWHFPGGGVETGETILEALTRELAEEANLTLAAPPELRAVFFNARISRRDHIALFLVRDFSQSAPRLPDRELAETGFFALDKLPEGLHPSTRDRINEILHGTPHPVLW